MTAFDVLSSAALALGLFAVTNVDDVLVLTVLFVSSARTGRPRPWGIVAGQYLGFTALVAASVAVFLGLVALNESWVRLLGVVPIVLGLRGLWSAFREGAEDAAPTVGSWWAVAGLTVANGADNISVYVPLLRTLDLARAGITLAVFYLGVAAWIAAARGLGRHRHVVDTVGRIEHWLGPLIFIALGVAILLDLL